MDDLRVALWREIGKIFPEGAEVRQPEGHDHLVVSWRLPGEGPPVRRSREVSIRFHGGVADVLRDRFNARGEAGLITIARRIADFLRHALASGQYDAEQEDRVPFLAYVGVEVLD